MLPTVPTNRRDTGTGDNGHALLVIWVCGNLYKKFQSELDETWAVAATHATPALIEFQIAGAKVITITVQVVNMLASGSFRNEAAHRYPITIQKPCKDIRVIVSIGRP